MLIGIICACTPAAAQACRHNLPSYETLKMQFLFHSFALRSSIKQKVFPSSVCSKEIKLDKQQHNGTSLSHGSYPNIDEYQFPFDSDFAQGQKEKGTIVRGRRLQEVEHDHV